MNVSCALSKGWKKGTWTRKKKVKGNRKKPVAHLASEQHCLFAVQQTEFRLQSPLSGGEVQAVCLAKRLFAESLKVYKHDLLTIFKQSPKSYFVFVEIQAACLRRLELKVFEF